MIVDTIDPLTDSRWQVLLNEHPAASIFHTHEWLNALNATYGYRPVVFTTSGSGKLTNGVVFCEVHSWLTGKRLVSLPFSDHCQPLAAGADLNAILDSLRANRRTNRWRYIELRPALDSANYHLCDEFNQTSIFSLQKIDLRSNLDAIYRRFHDSCVRRKIRRAERENLLYESGRSAELLKNFWHLLLLTRRRHKLPPQPKEWFENLTRSLGGALTIHVLSKDSEPVASIITLTHKKSLVYKYGCSDARFHNLGGTPLLFWTAIRQAKELGLEEFDLGRSAPEDPGLVAFKEHLGAVGAELRYYRSPGYAGKASSRKGGPSWAREVVSCLPNPILAGAGRLLYRHLG